VSSKNDLTVEQKVWLAAWTAAIQSGKYNPSEEARLCLESFKEEFSRGEKSIINE
jgi:hypothetical protein